MYSEDEVCQRLAACNFAVVQKPRLLSPWSEPRSLTDGEVARWSGIDVATQFPGGASFENPWNSPWTAAPGTAKPLCNNACAPLPGVSCEAMSPPLQGMQTLPSRFFSAEGYPVETDEAISWVSAPVISASYSDFWPVENTDRETPPIPIAPTEQNIELLRTCTLFGCHHAPPPASRTLNTDMGRSRLPSLSFQGVIRRQPGRFQPLHQILCPVLSPIADLGAGRHLYRGMFSQRDGPSRRASGDGT